MKTSALNASIPEGRPKGYAAWRPHSRTREVLTQIQAVLEEYSVYLPLTCRREIVRALPGGAA